MIRDNTYLTGNQFAKGQGPNRTSFKPGQKSWNKGRRGIHLSPATEFKKGHRSSNHQDIGTLTKRIDKNSVIRRWIKVAEPNHWQLYCVYLWEYVFGPVPSGYMIHHKNGLALDDRIENYELVTRAEHIVFHREQLLKARTFHLKVQFKLYPELTSKKQLRGYKFDHQLKCQIARERLKAVDTGVPVKEARIGQQALFD